MARKGGAASASSAKRPVDLIAAALSTDVVDVLRGQVVALSGLGRDEAYNAILNDPAVLDTCFRLFRARPDLFDGLVVDADHRPVRGDDGLLRCGRSLAEVVALVIRASAKRYFRRKLRRRGPAPRPPRMGTWQQLTVFLGLSEPPRAPPRSSSPAEKLYAAIRDYLRYDWQAAMIPFYATLSPQTVVGLGAHLLRICEPAQLKSIAGSPEARGSGRPPLLLDTASRLMPQSSDTVDYEMLFRVAQQMDLGRLFAGQDSGGGLRRAVAQAAAISPDAIRAMMPVLGHDVRLFATFLFVAYTTLGDITFKQRLGREANTRPMRAWMTRLAASPLPPPTLEAMKDAFVRVMTAGSEEAGTVAPAGKISAP